MPVDPSLDISSLISHVLHRQLQLPEFSQPVYIDDAQAIDTMVILSVHTRDVRTEQVIKTVAELAHALDQVVQHDSSHAQVNPGDFFLLVEATRIRLAYSFDPFFAVSLSSVQALPHQLQAVYERLLPYARLSPSSPEQWGYSTCEIHGGMNAVRVTIVTSTGSTSSGIVAISPMSSPFRIRHGPWQA